jgi:co-chaperonin GroES (HSP10)
MSDPKGVGHRGYQKNVKGNLIPIRDHIIVSDMNFEERTLASGIVIPGDDGKTEGIRHRWCKVWAIGNEQKDVKVGEWLLVEHGRWTRGFTLEDEEGNEIVLRRIENKAILMVSDEKPDEKWETHGKHTKAQGQTFTPDMFAR